MKTSHLNGCNVALRGLEHLYPDTRHIVVLVAGIPSHRAEVRAALAFLYNIVEFDDPRKARDYMRIVRPGALLLADQDPSALELISSVRRQPKYAKLPVLLIFEEGASQAIAAAGISGANDWLVRPYRRSELINLVSGSLNAAVETEWRDLPSSQAKALSGTLAWFNSLPDKLEKASPIRYAEVSDVCLPLTEAIRSGGYRDLLERIENHDNYTYTHSLRAAVFLTLFGQAVGLPEREQSMLTTGGLLYDIGKLRIPHLVLNKPSYLTFAEFEVMKGHVDASVAMLEAGEGVPKEIIAIAHQHHEKLDGSGYPHGLKADKLGELARMAAIVDIFSALTARRAYKSPVSSEAALCIMADEMAGHLDPRLSNRFREAVLD